MGLLTASMMSIEGRVRLTIKIIMDMCARCAGQNREVLHDITYSSKVGYAALPASVH